MIKFYLVTGFLGSGKTTFLKNFIPSLQPMKIHIIINEYGKESIDGPLLKTLETAIDEINNGSIFCSCKIDIFEETLEDAIKKNPDCIMVESSGLSDPSSIRSIINSSRFKNKLSYCGTICLTDALRFKKVYSTARCVKKQICSSDIVLLNKTDKASREDIIKTENLIKNQNPNIKIHRTSFGNFIKEWIDGLTFDKDLKSNDIYSVTSPDISIQRFLIEVNEKITLKNILGFLKFIAEDTYRIKGFIKAENEIYLINCVGTVIEVKKYEDHNWEKLGKLIILSGEGLPIRTSLKKGIDKYKDFIKLIK